MSKRYIKCVCFILVIGMMASSCQKNGFLDSNNDPNRVTDATITPELIFPQAAHIAASRQWASGNPFLEDWVGYFAGTGDFVRREPEASYKLDYNFGDGFFRTSYHNLFDLHQVEVKGVASGDTAIAAASMILSAKIFQELVDLFGDIPYSQAFQTDKYANPAYDKAKDIYDSLQKKLDKAILYMHLTPKKIFKPTDIVNHGNTTKWIKLANTMKLRLLIRQSEIPGFNPVPEIAKILAEGDVLMEGENVTVNPGYVNDKGKQSPFYAAYGYDVTGNKNATNESANDYIINILSSNKDPRISRFFLPVPNAGFVGNVYGDEQSNLNLSSSSSYFGPALVGTASQDQWVYPAYESLFLRAEAVARGWISGNASTEYARAVTESFVYLGVPNAQTEANNYMTNNASADFSNAGSTPLSQARFIAYQKYIANTGIDPLESYSDIRRLNMLTDNSYITIDPARAANSLPLRLLYPQSEYTSNASQVQKEGTINPYTTKLFWEP